MKKKTMIKPEISMVLVLSITLLLLAGTLNAQKKNTLITGKEVALESKVLDEERTISIYLPDNYDSSTSKYPVLYLLDGETHFRHASGAVNYLVNQGIIPQVIIVAIKNVDRNRDLSPTHVEAIPTSGGADKFLSFITDELTKYVNENFRTSTFTILAGHSFGGTFVVYTMLEKPDLFDAYIAMSPFLQYADNYIVNEARTKLKKEYNGQKYFYMTVGNEPEYFSSLNDFSALVKEKSGESVKLEYVRMNNENHATIPYVSVYNGLRYIFSDWQLPQQKFEQGLSAIDNHYKALATKYKTEVSAPEAVLNALGYRYLQKLDFENAIMIFIENVKRYPNSPNVYDSLGEAYEKNDQINQAITNYQLACDLGTKQNNANTAIYCKNLERVQKK